MAARQKRNVANGILSVFVLVCGIAFSVLIALLAQKLHIERRDYDDDDRSGRDFFHRDERHGHGRHHGHHGVHDDDSKEFMPHTYRDHHRLHHHSIHGTCWTFGFAFILTGIMGIISAFVKAKGAYITHMVFGIIALVVKGALFVFAIFAFKALTLLRMDEDICETVENTCTCTYQVYSYSCDEVNCMYKMMIGVLAVVLIGWILTLVTTVFAGILGCKKQVQKGVIVRSPLSNTVVQLGPGLKEPSKGGYLPPQSLDKAKLVSNMEVQPELYSK